MNDKDIKAKEILQNIILLTLCVLMLVLEYSKWDIVADKIQNIWINRIIQQACGTIAAVILMNRLKIKLFSKPQHLLYLVPCFLVAIDNFPFYSFFKGNMQFVRREVLDVILFGGYCIAVGLFEECVFRGILFAVLAGVFSKDKKGFLKTYFVSSVCFGIAHIFNLFMGAGIGETLLQVGYTILTGGLFGFALIKTKNLLYAGIVHAIYNFCGLLLSEQGLGTGIVFDIGTVIIMFLICIMVGGFVLYKVLTYSEEERIDLYKRLNVKAD